MNLTSEEYVKKAHLIVTLKQTVLDPQGTTILAALKNQGTDVVDNVRQGKFFELELKDGVGEEAARKEIERLAREVFINPVLEDFRYEILK